MTFEGVRTLRAPDLHACACGVHTHVLVEASNGDDRPLVAVPLCALCRTRLALQLLRGLAHTDPVSA